MEYTVSQISDSLNQAYTNKFEKVKIGRSLDKNAAITSSARRHLYEIAKQLDLKIKSGYQNGIYVYQPLYLKTVDTIKQNLVPLFTIDNTTFLTRYPFDIYYSKATVELDLTTNRYNAVVCAEPEELEKIPAEVINGLRNTRLKYPDLYDILLKLTDMGVHFYYIPSKYVRELKGVSFQ